MRILQVLASFLGRHGACLEHQNAGNDLKRIDDAMLHFRHQHFLLHHELVGADLKQGLFSLGSAPLSHVLKTQQDERAALISTKYLARVQQEDAWADTRKSLLDRKRFYNRL